MDDLMELALRCEQATGADRSIDRAIGFAISIGVEKERKLYVEMGDAMWVPTPELRGLTPYDRARGSTIRSEWVKGSRGRKGHYQDVRWGACDGPQPLTNSPLFTGSLDAATSLFPSDATYRSGHSALAPDPSMFFCDLVLADGRDFHALAHTETAARVAAALKSRAHSLPSANEAGRC